MLSAYNVGKEKIQPFLTNTHHSKIYTKKFHRIIEYQDGRNLKDYLLTSSCVVLSILEGRDTIQRDPDRLERGALCKASARSHTWVIAIPGTPYRLGKE